MRDDAETEAADHGASVSSLPDQFDRHVQQLFTFIGCALSAGRDRYRDGDDDYSDGDSDDSDDSDSDSGSDSVGYYAGLRGGSGFCDDGTGYCGGGGGGCGDDDDDRRSVSDNETVRRRSSHHLRSMAVPTVAAPFACGGRTISFERDVDRGDPPFRHMHCKTTAGTCNRVFLKKVTRERTGTGRWLCARTDARVVLRLDRCCYQTFVDEIRFRRRHAYQSDGNNRSLLSRLLNLP